MPPLDRARGDKSAECRFKFIIKKKACVLVYTQACQTRFEHPGQFYRNYVKKSTNTVDFLTGYCCYLPVTVTDVTAVKLSFT